MVYLFCYISLNSRLICEKFIVELLKFVCIK